MFRWCALLMTGMLAGCGAMQPVLDQPPTKETITAMQWPTAPGRARINSIGTFSSPTDLGYRAPLSARFKNLLGGKEDTNLIRPYAIDENANWLVIADPGAGQVMCLDKKRGLFKVIKSSNELELPSPVAAVLADDLLYVADSAAGLVYKFDSRLRLVGTLSNFSRPTSMAFDSRRKILYVADTAAHQVLMMDRQGNVLQAIGGRGSGDGEFNFPTQVALTEEYVLVVDAMNFRVQVFDKDGRFRSAFGVHGDQPGQFAQPKGIAVDEDGHIYVAESISGLVQIFDNQGAFLMAFGSGDRQTGTLLLPAGVHIEGDTIYVAESGNGRVQMYRYLGNGQ